jgi:hypothetical protein
MATKDILIDNPTLYAIELGFVRYFGWLMKLVLVLFIFGFLQNRPALLMQMLFVVKLILAVFLIYRFHPYRRHRITFTELDQKVVFSSAIYILLLSFSDVVVYYTDTIRYHIHILHQKLFMP